MTEPAVSPPLLLRAALLIDGTGATVEHVAVLVVGDLVEQVGAQQDVVPPDGADVLDLGDATLLPGLIDSHVHLTFPGTPELFTQVLDDDRATMLAQGRSAAAELVRAGVTTVRDLGALGDPLFRLRREIEAGDTPGPSIVASTAQLTSPDGPNAVLGGGVADVGAALDRIDADVDRGATVVKVIATGSVTDPRADPTVPVFDDATLRGIVEGAHVRGLRVAAHAHGTAGITQAVRCGVDSIEHASFLAHVGCVELGPGVVSRPALPSPTADALSPWPDGETLAVLADRRPWVVPTLTTVVAHTLFGPGTAAAVRSFAHRREIAGLMLERGVPLVAGTDGGTPGSPHVGLVVEIEQLHASGMTALEALGAATGGAAACLGLEDRGVVAAGRRADLIAVPGDPRGDLGVLRLPSVVVQGGRVVHRIEEAVDDRRRGRPPRPPGTARQGGSVGVDMHQW